MDVRWSVKKKEKHVCGKWLGLIKFIPVKIEEVTLLSWAIHHSSASQTWQVKEKKEKENTQRYDIWLPVALIKHVHYCMSSHQSARSAHQTLGAFCQKNCLMNEPLPEDPTSDSLRTLYLWQIVAVVILPILLHASFDIQMRVSSCSSAHLCFFV